MNHGPQPVQICVSSTCFQMNDNGWPPQPPTEKVLKFNKAEIKCLDDSEILSCDFSGLKTSTASMTSVASTASMASMTSTASFHQKNY